MTATAQANHPLAALCGQLLKEPFAELCGLSQMTLEQASELFETSIHEVDASHLASYESAKSIFCMMLLEIESSPSQWISATLAEIVDGSAQRNELPNPIESEPTALTPFTELEVAPEVPDPFDTQPDEFLRCPDATQHRWLTSKLLRLLNDTKKEHHPVLLRTMGQHSCFAVELEAQTRLAVVLSRFAQQRGDLHRKLFGNGRTFEPSADLQKALNTFQELAKKTGKDSNVDTVMITYALKYLTLSSTADLSRPSLVEMGVFLIFFCGAIQHDGWEKLSVSFPEANSVHLLELGLHLIRLQTLRNLTLNLHVPLTFLQSEEIEKRSSAVLSLLAQLGTKPEDMRKAG